MSDCYVIPHSTDPDAVNATERTIAMLPFGGRFKRNADGSFVTIGEYYVLECANPGFICFSIISQGYARTAVERIASANVTE
jgi:hypothetical protein